MAADKTFASSAKQLAATGFLWLFIAATVIAAEPVVDVRDCGAVADGKTLCTEAIQTAIDRCAAKGGGTVRLPTGTWLTGTVYLESHVTLLLEEGCVLLGSRKIEDYGRPRTPLGGDADEQFAYPAIIAGSKLQNVAITGRGTIDGQGDAFRDKSKRRPKAIYLVGCRDVLVENVKMRNAGSWMQHYRDCDRLTIRGINVFNHVTYNNDGLNVDSCRDVEILNCRVDSDDDGIVLKSLSPKPCQNVTIRDCVISSHCNAIKMGTESGGGFLNITVTGCTVHSPRNSEKIYGRQRGLAGIALEIVDGGRLDNVHISKIAIDGVSVPIFMRLGNRARTYTPNTPKPAVGTFRNVVLTDITATNTSEIGCSITGLPGHPVENISLTDIKLGFDGGGTRDQASREIPEKPESYPESTMFGVLPAWGFYCRHVKDLVFRNVQLRTTQPDLRHVMVCDDVKNLAIVGLDAGCSQGADAMIRLTQVQGAEVRGCTPPATVNPLLKLEGESTQRIVLTDNDLTRVPKIAELGPKVPQGALLQSDNRTVENP